MCRRQLHYKHIYGWPLDAVQTQQQYSLLPSKRQWKLCCMLALVPCLQPDLMPNKFVFKGCCLICIEAGQVVLLCQSDAMIKSLLCPCTEWGPQHPV